MTPSELKDAMRDVSETLGEPWTLDAIGKIRIAGRGDCVFCPVTAVCYEQTGRVYVTGDWRAADRALDFYYDDDGEDGARYFDYGEAGEVVRAADNWMGHIEESQACRDYQKAMLEVVNEGRA